MTTALIPLHDRHGVRVAEAIIDADLFDHVSATPWSLTAKGYVGRARVHGERYLHRLVVTPRAGMDVDHINGNKLDNRRSNLRVLTRSSNAVNSEVVKARSGHRNVHWDGANNKWRVNMRADGRCYSIGRFATIEEAVVAAAEARRRLQPTSRLVGREASLPEPALQARTS